MYAHVSEHNLEELVFPFEHVDPEYGAQVTGIDGTCLYSLSHFF